MGRKNDKISKGSTQNLNALLEPYACTGNFADDFSEIWRRNCSKDVPQPMVKPRRRPPYLEDDDTKLTWNSEEEDVTITSLTYHTVHKDSYFRPNIQCEMETEDIKQGKRPVVKGIHIKGWEINNHVITVMKQCMLDKLTTVNFWNAGLTDETFCAFTDFLRKFRAIKTVLVEGNAIPGEPFAELLNKELEIQHLSLRNNEITDVGAAKIGKALGSIDQSSPALITLVLAFNRISDHGAVAIANGLRMNRTLVSLSLASNRIGDEGAKALASSIDSITLTHEEIVERRKLWSQRVVLPRSVSSQGFRKGARHLGNKGLQADKTRQAASSPKRKERGKVAEKQSKKVDKARKENQKTIPKTPESLIRNKGLKNGPKARFLTVSESSDSTDHHSHPLLNPGIESKNGKVYMPGCKTLLSLNLARNQISVEGMKHLLIAIKNQEKSTSDETTAPGLLKLSLQRNNVAHDDPIYLEIFQTMRSRNPIKKNADELELP